MRPHVQHEANKARPASTCRSTRPSPAQFTFRTTSTINTTETMQRRRNFNLAMKERTNAGHSIKSKPSMMQKSENLKPEKMVDSSTFRFQVSALRPPPFPLHPRCDGVASGHDEKKTARDHAAVGKGQRPERARKDPICTKSRRNSRRAVEDARELSPLAELVHAFVAESIRFQVAGMSAAILQGVPATTLDTDLWINLPERQYVRVRTICR